MTIQKQEFYEGAALHRLIKGCRDVRISYIAPLYDFDGRLRIYLKYSTGIRGPWGFSFSPNEQHLLHEYLGGTPVVIGLICGADGIAALPLERYTTVAKLRNAVIRISCFRRHREYFELSGPDGILAGKIPPADWQRLLDKDQKVRNEP